MLPLFQMLDPTRSRDDQRRQPSKTAVKNTTDGLDRLSWTHVAVSGRPNSQPQRPTTATIRCRTILRSEEHDGSDGLVKQYGWANLRRRPGLHAKGKAQTVPEMPHPENHRRATVSGRARSRCVCRTCCEPTTGMCPIYRTHVYSGNTWHLFSVRAAATVWFVSALQLYLATGNAVPRPAMGPRAAEGHDSGCIPSPDRHQAQLARPATMTILHPLPPAEEPSPLLLLLQAELKLAQRDAHALGESYSGRHNVCAAKRPRNKYTPERNGELAPSSKRQRTSEAPAPMTVETCRMLSEHDRRHIVSECYEVNPSVDQLHKIRSISPVLASLMTPDEIQTCDRVPKMCMARQIQLHRFVRTFGSRFDHVSSTASCQTLNGLVQYFTGQLMRLLEDDIAVTNQCRSAWMQKRFDDLKAAKFTLETKWTVSERDPSSTSSTSSSPTSHCGHSMVFTRTAGGTHSDQ